MFEKGKNSGRDSHYHTTNYYQQIQNTSLVDIYLFELAFYDNTSFSQTVLVKTTFRTGAKDDDISSPAL